MQEEKTYSIGEAARMIGSTVKTVRYYDEIGLVKPAGYTEGGHRLYTTEDIWRLELASTLRYLDFAIDDIRLIISGEVPVDKALDWQIESLDIQVSTLNNMISILREAKKREGDSLRQIYDLVRERTSNNEKRKQFIAQKAEETRLFEQFPTEWKEPLLYFFNKYVVQQPKSSARQTAAWHELQELMNDPQFVADLKEVESKFAHVVQQPRYNAGTWMKKLEAIQERIHSAVKEQYAPGSNAVQSIITDMAKLYANSDEPGNHEQFFHRFADYCESTRTEHLERCNTLCAIISPQYHQLYKGNNLLYQGVQWRLKHLQP